MGSLAGVEMSRFLTETKVDIVAESPQLTTDISSVPPDAHESARGELEKEGRLVS